MKQLGAVFLALTYYQPISYGILLPFMLLQGFHVSQPDSAVTTCNSEIMFQVSIEDMPGAPPAQGRMQATRTTWIPKKASRCF